MANSNHPTDRPTREKALTSLQTCLCSGRSFTTIELLKIWKGLFFCTLDSSVLSRGSKHYTNITVQASSTPTVLSPNNDFPDPSHPSSSHSPQPFTYPSSTPSGKQSSNTGLRSPRYVSINIYICYGSISPTLLHIWNSTLGMEDW